MGKEKRSSNNYVLEVRQTHFLEVERTKNDALRMFKKVAETWGLTERQKIKLLGCPSLDFSCINSSDLFYDSLLRRNESEPLRKISEVLEVFLLCRRVFKSDKDAVRWLREACQDPLFCKVAPLTWMIYGGTFGMRQVKEYLEKKLRKRFSGISPTEN